MRLNLALIILIMLLFTNSCYGISYNITPSGLPSNLPPKVNGKYRIIEHDASQKNWVVYDVPRYTETNDGIKMYPPVYSYDSLGGGKWLKRKENKPTENMYQNHLISIIDANKYGKSPQQLEKERTELEARYYRKALSYLGGKTNNNVITAGKGTSLFAIGESRDNVHRKIGLPSSIKQYSDVIFEDYRNSGTQISYDNITNRVKAIFYFNNQNGYNKFAKYIGMTSRGITWINTVDDVTAIYGRPIDDNRGKDRGISYRRLTYAGIDFRFENGKMVRIAVPGN
jgi:hypothetical protein